MLLTYKIKHNRDFTEELRKARKVAEFCVKYRTRNPYQGENVPDLTPPPQPEPAFSIPPPLSLSSVSSSASSSPSVSSSSVPSPLSTCSPDFPFESSNDSTLLSFDPFFPNSSSLDSFPASKPLSPEKVKHIGLRSTISAQIIRKYSRNPDIRSAKHVKLTIPSRSIRINREEKTLQIPCLKLHLYYHFDNNFKKISQVEIDSTYAYVAVVFPEEKSRNSACYIGVDRNTKGHIAVAADPDSGKIWKLGKMCYHTHKKYENIKKQLHTTGKYGKLKAVKNREKNILKDLNHKISRKLVDIALENGCGIKLENLRGIRKHNKAGSVGKCKKRGGIEGKTRVNTRANTGANTEIDTETDIGNRSKSKSEDKNFTKNKSEVERNRWAYEYSLNSWTFRQLQQFIEYKARLQGVEVAYIDPHATSKRCSRCGHIGNRQSKRFTCPHCGHVDHADVNAAFNIALTPKGTGQFPAERDVGKGSPDTPRKATVRNLPHRRAASCETSHQLAWEVCQFLA